MASTFTRWVWIGAAVDFERHVDAVQRLGAMVRHAGGDRDPFLIRERRPLDRDRRDRHVRGVRIADGLGDEHGTVRQPHPVSAPPAAALKVGDEHHLAPGQGRFREDAAGQLQHRAVVGGASRQLRATPAPTAGGPCRTSIGARRRFPIRRTQSIRDRKESGCRRPSSRPQSRAPSDRRSPCCTSDRPGSRPLARRRRPKRESRRPGRTAARTQRRSSASAARRIISSSQ